MLGITMIMPAMAENRVVTFVKHPALVTKTVKATKVISKDAVKASKATARYGVKVLF
jgi:hypothetical protein